MKKIYLALVISLSGQALFGQTILNAGFEGELGPHPDYGTFSQRVDYVEGWENEIIGISLNASEEINAPAQGAKSLILSNVEDAAFISGQGGTFFGLSGTIVPGLTSQAIDLGAASNLASMQIGFMYKFSTTGEVAAVRAQVLDTVGTDKVLYEGVFSFDTEKTEWTAGTINLTATNQTGSAYVLIIETSTSKDYLINGGQATSPDTELKLDAFTIGYVGLEEKNAVNVIAFPNPTVEKLNFSSLEAIKNIHIFDANGKLVMNGSSSEMNVKELNNGIYTYEVQTISGKIARNTFVKN